MNDTPTGNDGGAGDDAEPAQVLADFFAESADAMVQMAVQVDLMAGLFRRHELTDAQAGLSTLTQELGQFVVLVDVLRGPLAIDAERLQVDGVSLDGQVARLTDWIETLIQAERDQDWLTVADTLELDLEPFLRAWGEILRDCGEAHPAADSVC